MALTDKLSNIADAIRSKTGKNGTMTLDEMPAEIAGITTGSADLLLPGDYPDYVHDEVLEIVNKVRSVRKSDSIVFVAMSDSHYPGDQAVTYYGAETRASMLQANQATKALTYMLDLDFVAHMGDVSWGGNDTTPEMLKSQIRDFVAHFTEAVQSIPMFICIGNHDTGIYCPPTVADGNVPTLSGSFLYNNFTAHSASEDTVIDGQEYGGYCYRDFADKKLRVFMLNTSEKLTAIQEELGTYGAQRLWLANALLNLNSKPDAAEWGFIILSHHPADYGTVMHLSELLGAYVNGTSKLIADQTGGYFQGDGTYQTVDFTNQNHAKFIGQFHGHIHNFKTDKLSFYQNSSKVSYEGWRVCTPNGQVSRENTYTTVGQYMQTNFSENTSYPKTAGTENGTSFVVNVINPSEEKIYSFAYGAGYDRVIGIASTTYYSITQTLTDVTTSNTIASIEAGESFTTTLASSVSGYDVLTVKVTMGGTDITNSVYSNGVITIPNVTGNIVITAKASKAPTSNLHLIAYSFEPNSTTIYNNGLGYKNGYRLNGSAPESWESQTSGYVLTGCIPWDTVSAINISGAELAANDGNVRMYMTNDARDYVYAPWIQASGGNAKKFEEVFTVETISTNKYKLTPKTTINSDVTCFAISLKGSGEDLIITFDNDNPSNYCTITNSLTNVTTNNNADKITINAAYTATLTVADGYELSSVKVVMGGTDITSTVYNNGVINIGNVTSHVVITAIANVESGYTNRIPKSTTTQTGTEIYNAPYGFKAGTRLNSSNVMSDVSGMCTSGFIPVKEGDVVRIKNVTLSGSATPYLLLYSNTNAYASAIGMNDLGSPDANGVYTWTVTKGGSGAIIAAMRLSIGVIDETSIVTVNEEII